jgi:hypothetical protein
MRSVLVGTISALVLAAGAQASIVTLTATFDGNQEVPANNSTATGSLTVTIDTATRAWTLAGSWGTLSAPLTVAHVHRAAAGVNGPVIVGLDGMPLSGGRPAWNLFAIGSTSLNSGGTLNAPFAWPAAELENLLSGRTYFNVHSTAFPSGEIRAQIIPTPAVAGVMGLAGLVATRRRRA